MLELIYMNSLRDIEKRFDEEVLGRCSDLYEHEEQIKSFYRKEIKELLEGLKEEMEEDNIFMDVDCGGFGEHTWKCSILTSAEKETNAKIDKLIK